MPDHRERNSLDDLTEIWWQGNEDELKREDLDAGRVSARWRADQSQLGKARLRRVNVQFGRLYQIQIYAQMPVPLTGGAQWAPSQITPADVGCGRTLVRQS